ncbi:MAG: bifunctional tetrahydrofolate synthase/dihydrofolate synthase [Gammaproteobacteria bacterium]|nr:MAG: bifunctional tetrahydrofolate synthase/dihydrofolate synthase [Gammaproteobacteria bacterium]
MRGLKVSNSVRSSVALSENSSLEEWLRWQESLHVRAIDLGLERVTQVATRLLPPQTPFGVISISGTNGKGTSASMLEKIYTAAGYKTGCYTSPHLRRYNERIRINGSEACDAQLCRSFARIENERGGISLTYFEFGTLAALDIFHREQVEIAILEVGLGGRLDAVNIVDADVALVCTIDIDHEQWLGSDRESIGREKAGIFRRGRPAVCSDPQPPQSIMDGARQAGAKLHLAGRDFEARKEGGRWSWRSQDAGSFTNLPCFRPDNAYLIRNATGVLMVISLLAGRYPVPEPVIAKVINEFQMPGRYQVLPGPVEYILDVAHNRQSMAELAVNLAAHPAAGRTRILIGMLGDKNHDQALAALSNSADFWYVVPTQGERGMPAAILAERLGRYVNPASIKTFDDMQAAFEFLGHEARPGDRVVVTGSFLTVAAALNRLHREM